MFAGDRVNLRPASCGADGAGASVCGLADGSGLAARPLHALYRPGRAHAAALRHSRPARMLCS